MPLLIESTAFEDGGIVPAPYSCFGENRRPGFTFSDAPPATVSYALILHDIDVALDGGTEDGLHWVVWNVPAEAGGIAEDALPPGSVVGRNVENENAYLGPGAPAGPRFHHYVLEVFALDRTIALAATASRAELLAAIEGFVVDKAAYVGRFKRDPGMTQRAPRDSTTVARGLGESLRNGP